MTVYRARWVLPIDAPPIVDGEVIVEDGLIIDVRPAQRGIEADIDFGDAILMPGFVNAHTHLEYTALRGFLEDVPFFPWIRTLNASKAKFTQDDWRVSSQLGALECIAGGVTTIGDNADATVTVGVAAESGLRATVYQEIFGIDHRDDATAQIAALAEKLRGYSGLVSDRVRAGVSPHALYTVRPALFAAIADFVAREGLPTSIHVAESKAESELVEMGSGPFALMLANRGIEWTVPRKSPTQYVAAQKALTPRSLAVHCVNQTSEDIALFAETGSAIVYCPKSNAKLGHGIAPLESWLETKRIRVALGTDSAVSNNTLDMFEEMRVGILMQRAAKRSPVAITARQMVTIATLGGAQAMGIDDCVGSLTPGKRADMIAVSLRSAHATPATDPYSALVYSSRADDVTFTLADGQVLYDHGAWKTLDAPTILLAARQLRSRISLTVTTN